MTYLSPLKYPTLYSLLNNTVSIDADVEVEEGLVTFRCEVAIRLPKAITNFFG